VEDLSSESFDALTVILGEEEPEKRRAIVQELGRRGRAGETRAIPFLIGMLSDPGDYVAEAASDTLWPLGEAAVMPLVDVLRDRGAAYWAHVWAARTLMYIHDPRGVAPMLDLVQDPNESLEKRGAITAYLGYMKDERAVQPLIDLLKDDEVYPELRAALAGALGNTGDRRAIPAFIELLHREDARFQPATAQRELQKLQAAQQEASGDLAAQLAGMVQQLERGRSLHDRILGALRAFRDPGTLDFLLPQLATDDVAHRTSIAAVIGDMREPALEPLLQATDSEDARVREGAAKALGFMADPRAISRLTNVLRQDSEAAVRRAAASSLGFINDDRVMEPLVVGLRDPDMYVRQASAHALHHLAMTGRADAGVLPVLEEAARSDEGQVYGHYVVRDAAGRAVSEINRVLQDSGKTL
jgi:HEAT repeat protein